MGSVKIMYSEEVSKMNLVAGNSGSNGLDLRLVGRQLYN